MKKGFTLIELLVVLVIIGILIALILPNTLRAINQGNIRNCASNLRQIDTAAQMCFADNQTWANCDTVNELVAGNFLENQPVCPFGTAYGMVQLDNGFASNKGAHFANWPRIPAHL